MQKTKFSKMFSNPYVWKKTNTHIYDVHEAKIVKFIATGSEIQTLGRGLFGHKLNIYQISKNRLFFNDNII